MSFDDAYEALTDHDDDARWAYGTGFTDPLAGVDNAVPDGIDRGELAAYCLMLGDDALIMSHRLQQWVTRAPELEDELALANIALDLLGQAERAARDERPAVVVRVTVGDQQGGGGEGVEQRAGRVANRVGALRVGDIGPPARRGGGSDRHSAGCHGVPERYCHHHPGCGPHGQLSDRLR